MMALEAAAHELGSSHSHGAAGGGGGGASSSCSHSPGGRRYRSSNPREEGGQHERDLEMAGLLAAGGAEGRGAAGGGGGGVLGPAQDPGSRALAGLLVHAGGRGGCMHVGEVDACRRDGQTGGRVRGWVSSLHSVLAA